MARRLYPQTILIPEQICLEFKYTYTHVCAHINSCGFATAAFYVGWPVPPQSLMFCPVVFLKLSVQVFQKTPAIHEWGLETCFLIVLLTADGWFLYYQNFKKQKDLAVEWLGVKEK